MNKNLKKVISSIAALAMTAGIMVAPVSASDFPDVPAGAAYGQAVNELVALEIVNGDENGMFRPDDNIVRSEVTKLVVAAMGPAMTAAAIGAAGTDTGFTDVPPTYWASGYIAQGVANKFINGNGDGTFTPEDNVTYAQIVKMLAAAMGYTAIAEKNGGYPNGYLTTAANIGITEGVTVAGAETVVTRAQVAQLVDNAINIPIVAVSSMEENSDTGALIAKTSIMDVITSGGDAKDYRTILTDNHNVYKVKGRITATNKSGSVEKGQVKYKIEAAKNFDNLAYGSSYNDPEDVIVNYDGEDADDLLYVYSEALIKKDANDEFTLICITPTGANKTEIVEANLYASADLDSATNPKLEFYTSKDSNKTKTYKLSVLDGFCDAEMYVNGVQVDLTYENLSAYIGDNDNGTVTLIDATAAGKTTTDGKYDYILVNYYVDATVKSVALSGTKETVYFENQRPDLIRSATSIKIDTDDDDVTATYWLDGVKIDVTELMEGDVMSIAYDVTQAFNDSGFYDIYVSRDTVTGKVTGRNVDDNGDIEYTINGEKYMASKMANTDTLETGNSYVLGLNAFGKYVTCDEDSASKLIAVFDKASVSTTDERKITLITTAGSKISYNVKDNISEDAWRNMYGQFYTDGSMDNDKRVNLVDRIVEYTLNSAGQITSVTKLTSGVVDYTGEEGKARYTEKTQKLGSKYLDDSVVVLDLSSSDNGSADDIEGNSVIRTVSAKTVQALADDCDYRGILADKSNISNNYRLFILTEGESKYSSKTPFAVYKSAGDVVDDGTTVTCITAVYDGSEEFEVRLDPACEITYGNIVNRSGADLKTGDAFIFNTGSDGLATEVVVIYNGLRYDYAEFAAAINDGDLGMYDVQEWVDTIGDKTDETVTTFGAITRAKNGGYDIAAPTTKFVNGALEVGFLTDTEDDGPTKSYTVANDVNVSVYDFSERNDKRVTLGSVSNIIATNAYMVKVDGSDKDNFIPLYGEGLQEINFAFAKVVDDEITDILVIYGTL